MSNPVERLHPALGLSVAVSKPHSQLLEGKIPGVIQKTFRGERRTKLYLHQQLEPSDPLKWQNQEGRKGQAFALGIQLQLWDHFPESWLVLAEKREREKVRALSAALPETLVYGWWPKSSLVPETASASPLPIREKRGGGDWMLLGVF